MTVQPHQAPRCAADSSANCVSPGSGMRLQPLAPAGAAPGSICFLLVVHRHRGWMELDHPPYGGETDRGRRLRMGYSKGTESLKITEARGEGHGKNSTVMLWLVGTR